MKQAFKNSYTCSAAGKFGSMFSRRWRSGILIGIGTMLMSLSANAQTYTNILSGNWSTAGNWKDSSAPPVGGGTNVIIVFGNGQSYMDVTNDYAGVFTNTSMLFTRAKTNVLSGNNIYMMTNIVSSNAFIYALSNAVINCVLEGTQGIAVRGAGELTLAGNNTFSGNFTNVTTAWKIYVGHNNAFGSATIYHGGISAQRMASDSSTARTITNALRTTAVNPSGLYFGDTTRNGVLTFSGPITLGANFVNGRETYFSSPVIFSGPVTFTHPFKQLLGTLTFQNCVVDGGGKSTLTDGSTTTQKFDNATFLSTGLTALDGGTFVFTNSVVTNTTATTVLTLGDSGDPVGSVNSAILYGSTMHIGTNGTTTTSGGVKYVNSSANSRHELHLINSTLTCRRIFPNSTLATTPLYIYLNGGRIRIFDGYYTNVINSVTPITILSGGGYFDDINDGTLYTATPLSGSGDFYKLGAGQWNLAGRNINSGSMVFSNGIVNILNRINNSTNIDIKTGATLTFSNRTTITQAATIRLATGATNGLQFSGDIALDQLFTNNVKLAPGVYSADNLPGVLTGTGRIFSDFAVSDTIISKDYSRPNFYYFHGTNIP